MSSAEDPAVGTIPSGGSSRATGKETAMAIAGAMLRSPENLSELLWVVRRIIGHNTGALDKGLSACTMVLLIWREGCGDRRMSRPELLSFLDCDNLALLESGPPHSRSRYGHEIQLAGRQSSDTQIFP